MADVLVDTDVFSFLFRRDTRASAYARHLDGRSPALSFMTVAEVYRWTVIYRWGEARVAELLSSLRMYSIFESDDETAWHWARVIAVPGHPMSTADAWVAATALRHDIPLVTHNRRHFAHVPDLRVLSEAP